MMVDVLPYVVGKKAGASDGSTVVLVLTGPLARTTAVGVVDGRARALEAVPDAPTVTVTLDAEAYSRLASGRADPSEALALGAVVVDGDVELGGRVVHQLNYLF